MSPQVMPNPYDAADLAWVLSEAERLRGAEQSRLDWAKQNATIVLPTTGKQPFDPYPYQAALLQDYSLRRLILKARQTGVSNCIAIEALHKCITRPDSTELFVSRSLKAAEVLIQYCQHTLNGLRNPPRLVNENQSGLVFANGSRIISLPASPGTGRSIAATDAYLDEFGFAQYDALIYESVIGTVSTGGGLTVLSTANGRNNMFFRLWEGMEGGKWSRHKIHWTDCPRYTQEWADQMRADMTREAFAQEFDCDFLASGGAVFNPDDLKKAKDGWNPDPNGCTRFVTGWDIGRRRDHSVGITIGRRTDGTWHEIDFWRKLVPYPVTQGEIETRKDLRGGKTLVESNGVGDPVIENLLVKVDPFVTTQKSKVQAIQALQLLIQKGRFKYGNPQLDRELGLYQWDDTNLVQDSVMAASIAAYGTNDTGRGSRPASGGGRPMTAGYAPR